MGSWMGHARGSRARRGARAEVAVKVGDRVSVVVRLSGGARGVVRALVRENHLTIPDAYDFVCVRVPLKQRSGIVDYPDHAADRSARHLMGAGLAFARSRRASSQRGTVSRFVSSWLGATVLTHEIARWIAPAHVLAPLVEVVAGAAVALWATQPWRRAAH